MFVRQGRHFFRKLFASTLFLCFWFSISVLPTSAENLIPNGGFELEDAAVAGNPAGWGWNAKTMSLVRDGAPEGKNFVKIVVGGGGLGIRNIAVEPRTNYRLSAKIKTAYPENIEIPATMEVLDKESKQSTGSGRRLSNHNEWYELTRRFYTFDCDQIMVIFNLNPGSQDAWIAVDDVLLEKDEPIPPLTNIVSNTGFELGEPGRMPVDWFSAFRDRKDMGPFAGLFETSGEVAHSGKQSFFVECELGQQFCFQSAVQRFEPGARYALSLWMKSNQDKVPVFAGIMCGIGSLGHKYGGKEFFAGREWQEYKVEYDMPSGDEYRKQGIYIQIGGNAKTEGFALWIDDVNLNRVK